MKHLDLFSGIGGFALAADRVFGKVEHTFCEIDPFCQLVLKKHWPKAKIYGDIRTLTNTTSRKSKKFSAKKSQQTQRKSVSSNEPPFLLTGGFPCQPFSQAGRRKGTEDDRHLWPEMLRVIREFTPVWVVGENVGGFVTWNDGMVLRQVFSDLEGEGYEVQAFIIPAVALNAPHRRDRIWIIGHSKHDGGARAKETRKDSGVQPKSKTRKKLFINEREGDGGLWTEETRRNNATDTKRKGHKGQEYKTGQSARHSGRPQWDQNWFEVATKLCRVDDGLPRRMDRNPRFKALGNAIVPAVAEEIFKAIKEITPCKSNLSA